MDWLRGIVSRLRTWLRTRDEQSATFLGWLAGVSREPPAWKDDEDVE